MIECTDSVLAGSNHKTCNVHSCRIIINIRFIYRIQEVKSLTEFRNHKTFPLFAAEFHDVFVIIIDSFKNALIIPVIITDTENIINLGHFRLFFDKIVHIMRHAGRTDVKHLTSQTFFFQPVDDYLAALPVFLPIDDLLIVDEHFSNNAVSPNAGISFFIDQIIKSDGYIFCIFSITVKGIRFTGRRHPTD